MTLLKKYSIFNKPYKECLIPDNREYLIKIKKGILSEEEATKLASLTDEDTYRVKELEIGFGGEADIINQKGIDILNKVKFDLLENKFKEDLGVK